MLKAIPIKPAVAIGRVHIHAIMTLGIWPARRGGWLRWFGRIGSLRPGDRPALDRRRHRPGMVDEDAGGAFQMLVDRLHQRHEGLALLLESLAQKARLIRGFHLAAEMRPLL